MDTVRVTPDPATPAFPDASFATPAPPALTAPAFAAAGATRAGAPATAAGAAGRLAAFEEPASALTDRGASARFVTGDAIRLDMRVARLGSRMLARLIDVVLQVLLLVALSFGLTFLVGVLASAGAVQFDESLVRALVVIVLVLVVLGFPVAMELLTRGRSAGKALLGLRVVRDDGGPIRFRHAMTRGLVGAAIEWPGMIAPPLTWLACLTTMVVSPTGKRLGDYAAGTLVIHERTPQSWGWVPTMPPGYAAWAATLDLAGVDDNLALAVRHFLARNKQLREPARTQLGHALAAEVAAVTNPPPPPGMPGWAYLATVHAERHRRALQRLAAVRSRAALVWPELTQLALAAPPPRPPRNATRRPPYPQPPQAYPQPPHPSHPAGGAPTAPGPTIRPAQPVPAEHSQR
ncbi:RDD family protein [Luedemannella helvata]|uniref:RDD domain-containing protein n=1 Tax=Luedemannella helvata TaxID=349315 RepID=A0ABN2K0H6_9ACTN